MTSESPRAVISVPVFGHADHLGAAVASLLAQTFTDFRLLLVDDKSCDESLLLARSLAGKDDRVRVISNERRLGLLANTRRAYALGRAAWPDAAFWALGSDHDVWEPRWLEALVAALDARPGAVLAYPLSARVDEKDRYLGGAWRFSTAGVTDPHARLRRVARGMVAGEMVYGLFRTAALDALGDFYEPVLYPDRLLLARLALEGEFVQVPEVLWRRRIFEAPTAHRQRRASWPAGAPVRAYLPPLPVHVARLLRACGPRPALVDYMPAAAAAALRTGMNRLLYAVGRRVAGALVRSGLGARVITWKVPMPSDYREALARKLEDRR